MKIFEKKIDNNKNYLFHIPHDGNLFYNLNNYYLNQKQLENEHFLMSDNFVSLLINYNYFKSNFSRISLDVERLIPDEMDKYGMSFYYTKTSQNKKLRSLRDKYIIYYYYKKYHLELENIINQKLKNFDTVNILDLHSFPNENRFYENNNNKPDICIGFDEYHKNSDIIDQLKFIFKDFKIKENYPFKGSIVPLKYFNKNNRIKSTMLEINRKLYIKNKHFDKNMFNLLKNKLKLINF